MEKKIHNNSTMEAETILKNGASPKRRISRGNLCQHWLMTTCLLLLMSSCVSQNAGVSYNNVYTLTQYCDRIDGVWGVWKKNYSEFYTVGGWYAVTTQYNSLQTDIFIYYENKHPSEFNLKFTINKTSAQLINDGIFAGGCEYTGRAIFFNNELLTKGLHYLHEVEVVAEMSGYAQSNKAQKYDIPITIRCDKEMKKALDNNGLYGTLNILYSNSNSGTGLIFGIK
jgi:hypothetical protein